MATDKTTTRGLQKIEFGTIPTDGGITNQWFRLGYTRRETFTFNSEDGDTTDFYSEESDTAIDSITVPGKESFEFDLMNFNLETLQKLFGGTIKGTGDEAIYCAPNKIEAKEWSCKITPEKGYIFAYPRVSIMPKLSGSFTKNELMQIHLVCTILEPTKEGVPKWQTQKFIKPLIRLDSILKSTDLGKLKDNNAETILNRVNELNPLVDISNVEVSNITKNSATISEKAGGGYIGSVNVGFTVLAQ